MDKNTVRNIAAGLIVASICAAAAAVIKVNVVDEKVRTQKELLDEIRHDVKWIRQELYNIRGKE